MTSIIAALVGSYLVLVGLLVGSFINLAADRLPRGESLVRPRSHCRTCNRQLNAIDLLPVLGHVLRRGRCATCGASIGITSPVVEALCGGCAGGSIAWFGLWPGAVVGTALILVVGLLRIGGTAIHREALRPG